jgi:hypothetical protein
VDPLRDGAAAFGYMFFGDTPFPRRASKNFAVWGAMSGFKVPAVIQRIAVDRSRPYFARERKRVRNVIRFGDTMNPPVYKSNYMTRNYALGSLDGGLQQPIQIHTWSVTYRLADGRVDNLFALHPYYSARELGMFFPEKLKVMVSEVVKSKGTYDKEDKWTGGSPFERTFQHRNTLIALYDLAPDTPYRHIDYYFPKSLSRREEDVSGWIFAQGGQAYIAVYPVMPGEWREEESCFRLRSPFLRNGLIVEVAQASEYDGWDAFKRRIRSNAIDASRLASAAEVGYITSSGDRMRFRFPDWRVLNGERVDLAATPLFDGPYMQGNDRVLRIRHGADEIILDFKALAIIESKTGSEGF